MLLSLFLSVSFRPSLDIRSFSLSVLVPTYLCIYLAIYFLSGYLFIFILTYPTTVNLHVYFFINGMSV